MEPWITRNEINRITQLPKDDNPGKFIKKKPKTDDSIRIKRPRIPLPKNPQIFEEIKYTSDYDSDWQPNLDEITADIQALDGEPLCTDTMLEAKWKQLSNNTNKKNNINDIPGYNGADENKKKKRKIRSSRQRNRPLYSNNILMRNLVEKQMENLKI